MLLGGMVFGYLIRLKIFAWTNGKTICGFSVVFTPSPVAPSAHVQRKSFSEQSGNRKKK